MTSKFDCYAEVVQPTNPRQPATPIPIMTRQFREIDRFRWRVSECSRIIRQFCPDPLMSSGPSPPKSTS